METKTKKVILEKSIKELEGKIYSLELKESYKTRQKIAEKRNTETTIVAGRQVNIPVDMIIAEIQKEKKEIENYKKFLEEKLKELPQK